MGFFSSFFSGPKLWQVGDHRAKSYKTHETMPRPGEFGKDRSMVTRFKCVDCEQKAESRDELAEMDCYDVVQ